MLNQPESWDDDDDGIWKPRMIPNPEYKGPWKRKVYFLDYLYSLYLFIPLIFIMHFCSQKIKNPNYKGKWKTPWIDNPGETVTDIYIYLIFCLVL